MHIRYKYNSTPPRQPSLKNWNFRKHMRQLATGDGGQIHIYIGGLLCIYIYM